MLNYALTALLSTCAPMVAPSLMESVITVESSGNPYAIGVVGAKLQRQPRNINEAVATVRMLESKGFNYSVGTAQVNKYNFSKYGLNPVTAFDTCTNLNVGGQILQTCYLQSLKSSSNNNEHDGTNRHIKRALSCYYSGKLDSTEGHKYANQVLLAYR